MILYLFQDDTLNGNIKHVLGTIQRTYSRSEKWNNFPSFFLIKLNSTLFYCSYNNELNFFPHLSLFQFNWVLII